MYGSKDLQVFVQAVLKAFDKALSELAKIPDLEPKILADLYKSKGIETPIRTPNKPTHKPRDPDPNERP